jgi:glycosyltransferase involved in cell wall biosynthesis
VKKIAYIEIDTHAEIAQAFMEIIHGSKEFEVDYYFSKKIRDQISESGETVFLSDSSMIMDQLKGQKYDLVIIGTIHRYFNTFLAVAGKFNTAVMVHNINFATASKLDLMKSIFKGDVIYRLKLWWKEGLFYSPKTYRKAKNILVLDKELSSASYRFLPLFYTKDFTETKNENITIVIPGGVSQKRRDYHRVFEIIHNIKSSDKYSFVFLGKAKDEELNQLEKLSKKLSEGVSITYFENRISSADFEKWMQKADVLWCPIQQETEFFGQKEIYGTTKMTGNLGDAIKYGKIAVFPENYPSKLAFIIPEKENVIEQFKELKNIHFDFQKNYNKQKVQQEAEQVLHSLISI